MAGILSKYAITYGEGATPLTFFFLAPPNHYDGIADLCGVEKIEDTSDLADMPLTKTEELAISPVASRKTLRIKVGTKLKYADILIAAVEAIDADNTLKTKPYKGGVITRVLDSRKKTTF